MKAFFNQYRPGNLRADGPLLTGLAVLSLIGVLTVFSSVRGSPLEPCWWRQIVWLSLGWVAMVLVSGLNYRSLAEQAWVPYAILMLFLIYLLVFGRSVSGARSWISLGFMKCQPSEIMKFVVLLVVAHAFARHRDQTITAGLAGKLMLFIGAPALLVAMQPDLGTAIVFMGIFGVSLVLAGLKRSTVLMLILAGVAASGVMWKYGLKDYQKKRITSFLNPEADPLGGGYHLLQSKIAIGSGGWFGKGFGQGYQNQLDFVPETHTDFVVTVFAEELGFAGVVFLLGLLLFITWRCLRLAEQSRSPQGLVLASGVAAVFACHCLVNIGMVIGLLPTAGIPLPMMSYGGSSTLAMMTGFGFVLSVGRDRYRAS